MTTRLMFGTPILTERNYRPIEFRRLLTGRASDRSCIVRPMIRMLSISVSLKLPKVRAARHAPDILAFREDLLVAEDVVDQQDPRPVFKDGFRRLHT
jgi:hypothetical protein